MIDLSQVIKIDGISYEDRERAIKEKERKLWKVVKIGIVISLTAFFGGIGMIIFGG